MIEMGESSNSNRHRARYPMVRNVGRRVASSENQSVVRSYARSKKPRLKWTVDLHRMFLCAVLRLGGEDRATPNMILHAMGVDGITVAHIKSHLQMYRSVRHGILIQEALEAAKKSGRDKELIAQLPQLMNAAASRPVTRRQTRLQSLKGSLIKNALDEHFPGDHHQMQLSLSTPALPPPKIAENSSAFSPVRMLGEPEKRSGAYMMFNEVAGISNKASASAKGKEKMAPYNEYAGMGADLSLSISKHFEDISLELSL